MLKYILLAFLPECLIQPDLGRPGGLHLEKLPGAVAASVDGALKSSVLISALHCDHTRCLKSPSIFTLHCARETEKITLRIYNFDKKHTLREMLLLRNLISLKLQRYKIPCPKQWSVGCWEVICSIALANGPGFRVWVKLFFRLHLLYTDLLSQQAHSEVYLNDLLSELHLISCRPPSTQGWCSVPFCGWSTRQAASFFENLTSRIQDQPEFPKLLFKEIMQMIEHVSHDLALFSSP